MVRPRHPRGGVGDLDRVLHVRERAVEDPEVAVDGAADFVVFKGRSWTELLSRPESDRIVVREGRAIERRLPDYAELDELMVT